LFVRGGRSWPVIAVSREADERDRSRGRAPSHPDLAVDGIDAETLSYSRRCDIGGMSQE
jgi:hypothetical protein